MHLRTNCAGRFRARLGLESLEGRMLLSSTTLPSPSPAPAIGSHTSQQTQVQATSQSANYSFSWAVGPTSVLVGTNPTTGNGRSTGSVDFALVRNATQSSKLGAPASSLPIGFLVTTSSAEHAHPDVFHASFTLQLQLRDASSGATGVLTFKGTINGTLTWDHSALTATFQSPLTQKLTLGNHVYTVTLPSSLHANGPWDVPTPIYAQVQVKPR
jgi:hypothetical protein